MPIAPTKISALALLLTLTTTTNASLDLTGDVTTRSFNGTIINIGNDGIGSAILQSGNTFAADHYTYIGNNANSSGTLTIKDPGTNFTSSPTNIMYVGYRANGNLIVSNGATAYLGHISSTQTPASTATILFTDTDTSVSARALYSGTWGTTNTTLSSGANINITDITVNGFKASGYGTLNIHDPGTLLNSPKFHNGISGIGNTTLSNGATITATDRVRNGDLASGIGIITIKDNNSKITTDTFNNGYGGTGFLKLSNSGQLFANSFTQNATSATILTLSGDYLSSTDHWAITTDSAILGGNINALTGLNPFLQNNQTYNLMQVSGNIGNLAGTFTSQPQDSSIGILGTHEIFISYTGGDGNDIVLYTTTALTNLFQGDANFDNQINESDLQLVLENFGSFSPDGDASHDFHTGLTDLIAVRNNFTPTPPATIPEPTTLFTLLDRKSVV